METRQNYETLLNMIDRMGNIEDVATNPEMIKTVLGYDTDRHLFCALIDRINEAVEAKKMTYEEIPYFQNGRLMDDIVNLKRTIQEYGNHPSREVYTSEILDKVNYVGLIQDPKTLAACYTHPEIIAALSGEGVKNTRDLKWWSTCGTYDSLPAEVKQSIIFALMKNGAYEEAAKLCEDDPHKLPISSVRKNNEHEFRM